MGYGMCSNVNEVAQETIKLVAAAARKVGDPVVISTGNATFGVHNDASLSDGTTVARHAVALQDAAASTVYTACVKGTCKVTVTSGTYTTGDGAKIHDGAVADSSAVCGDSTGEVGDNVLGIIAEGGTTVTSIKITLLGYALTPTT